MKLRVRGNSVRLRLTRSEVERLAREGQVAERVDFGQGIFDYVVALGEVDHIAARVEATGAQVRVTVTLPHAQGRAWAVGAEVSLTHVQHNGAAGLTVVVEKDFQCLTPRGEDDADAFPHPQAAPGATC